MLTRLFAPFWASHTRFRFRGVWVWVRGCACVRVCVYNHLRQILGKLPKHVGFTFCGDGVGGVGGGVGRGLERDG